MRLRITVLDTLFTYVVQAGCQSPSVISGIPIQLKSGTVTVQHVCGNPFQYCSKGFCPHLASLSGPVKHVNENEYRIYEAMAAGEKTFHLQKINCSYDRSCNLRCPSCRTELKMAKRSEREQFDELYQGLLEAFGH